MSEAETKAETPVDGQETPAQDDISTEAFDRAPAPEDDETEQSDASAEDQGGESSEDTQEQPDDDTEEIEHEGQKIRVPKAARPLLMMQADYTRKTQEAAEARRAFEEQTKAWETERTQQAESFETLRAEHTKVAVLGDTIASVQAKVAEWEGVDWDTWSAQVSGLPADDPNRLKFMNYSAAYTADRNRLASLNGQLETAKTDLQTKEADRLAKQRETADADLAKRRQETGRALRAEDQGWTVDRFNEVIAFAADLGIQAEEMGDVTDPRVWKMLHRLKAAEAEVVKLKKTQQQQKTADNHEKAQGVKPAATTKGTGGQPRDPSTARGDQLSMDEWKRRRAAQKGIALR